jgi:hypothetical protein
MCRKVIKMNNYRDRRGAGMDLETVLSSPSAINIMKY